MRAIAVEDFATGPVELDLEIPKPGAGEVLVRVARASVNGFDAAVAAGMAKDFMEHRFPVVLGKDFAGTVEAVGEGVSSFAPGERVFGVLMRQYVGDGTFADYVVVPEAIGIAERPAGLSEADAGALGLAGATALAGVDALQPGSGQTVLVSGATGGVGAYAVQLASARGAEVIATARPGEEAEFVTKLGAKATVDWTADLVGAVRSAWPQGVDAVLHLAGEAQQLAGLVRPGGRFASSLGAGAEQFQEPDIEATAIVGMPSSDVLEALAAEVGAGRLRVPVQRAYALGDVPQSLIDFRSGKLGKLAIDVAA